MTVSAHVLDASRGRPAAEGAAGITGFHPEVSINFRVTEPERHHHVPLLLSPYAYSTYGGS